VRVRVRVSKSLPKLVWSFLKELIRYTLRKIRSLENSNQLGNFSKTLFGFRKSLRSCKAFSKRLYWFPRSRKTFRFSWVPIPPSVRYTRILFYYCRKSN
jgi:hypothetical protein